MKLKVIESKSYDPYTNLALEEWLLNAMEEDEVILYLWQNAQTVVIGRNQNAWKECNVSRLEAEGGHLARRLSGGGAVYHDLGNMNFTFLAHKAHYDTAKQNDVIFRALRALGFEAEKSGRNDLLVEGKKISGHAYYEHNGRCYHHGTLLVDVDKEKMSHYLNVAPDKLKGKGVSSVKSRVGNLAQMKEDLNIDELKSALKTAFADVYEGESDVWALEDVNQEQWAGLTECYGSWAWKFGRTFSFDINHGNRFAWGRVDLALKIDEGVIVDAEVYSDALVPDMIDALVPALLGTRYESGAIAEKISAQAQKSHDYKAYLEELAEWARHIEC